MKWSPAFDEGRGLRSADEAPAGTQVVSWLGRRGTVVKVETDPELKPIVALMDDETMEYYHLDQVEVVAE